MLMQILVSLIGGFGLIMVTMIWYYVKRRDEKQDELIATMYKLGGWVKELDKRVTKLEDKNA